MSDETELLKRLCDGDDAALEELLVQHLPALHGFVRLRAGREIKSHEETVDIVQSVCREVLARKERFKHPSENGFRRWLYRTALRKLSNRAEYWRAGKRDSARVIGLPQSHDDVAGAYASICSPSQALAAREEVERVESAFDELPDNYREVVVLRRIAGWEYAEIAAELNKSEQAVRSIHSRALARLAELL